MRILVDNGTPRGVAVALTGQGGRDNAVPWGIELAKPS